MTVKKPAPVERLSARDGFIIVAVLWILIALATLASIYSIYVSNSALAISAMDDRLQAEALVSASLELTAYRLYVPKDVSKDVSKDASKDTIRPARGQFAFRLGRANVLVNYSSETARLDLNAAPKPLLAGFFMSLGVPSDNADRYADRIIGWRKPSSRTDQGNEDALYRAAGLSYLPRGAPFAHISELWLVQGLPPAVVRRAMPLVTVFSGRPDINVFAAAPALVAALPGMSPVRLTSFLNERDTVAPTKESLERLLGPNQPGATAEGGNAFRVTIDIAFPDGWRTRSEVVILLGAGDEPYQVFSWRNDVESDSDQPQLAKTLR